MHSGPGRVLMVVVVMAVKDGAWQGRRVRRCMTFASVELAMRWMKGGHSVVQGVHGGRAEREGLGRVHGSRSGVGHPAHLKLGDVGFPTPGRSGVRRAPNNWRAGSNRAMHHFF